MRSADEARLDPDLADHALRTLSSDPLAELERALGRPVSDGDAITAIALGLENEGAKAAAIRLAGDTDYGAIDDYLRVVAAEGFVLALTIPFQGEDDKTERLMVFAKEGEGLLAVSTYSAWPRLPPQVNEATLSFNWRALPSRNTPRPPMECSGSGSVQAGVHCGELDVRRCLRSRMLRLRQTGSFVTPWVATPFTFALAHYGDHRRRTGMAMRESVADLDRVRGERVGLLPPQIRAMFGLKD